MRYARWSTYVALGILAGCAGREPVMQQTMVPSDMELDCSGLQVAYDGAVNEALAKQKTQVEKDNADVALGAVGVVLFLPALFFIDTKNAEGAEALNLMQRATSLHAIAVAKPCDVSLWRPLPELELVAPPPPAGREPEEVKLTGEEIRTVLAGADAEGVKGPMSGYSVQYLAHGTLRGTGPDATGSDEGRWAIDEDRICEEWGTWGGGSRRCYSVYDRGEGEYRLNPGGGRSSAYIRVGER